MINYIMKKLRKADEKWHYFELSTAERKAVSKYLKKQEKGILSKPVYKLTLNRSTGDRRYASYLNAVGV